MAREPWPDLSVQISRRRWRCVPDLDLCLTQSGAALVYALAPHAEIWLTPEFLDILDSWVLYDREPELLSRPWPDRRPDDEWEEHRRRELAAQATLAEVPHALRIWRRLRDDAGRAGGLLHWVRDASHESCLPPGAPDSLVQRWEAMAEALETRLPQAGEAGCGPYVATMRDATALAGVLGGAAVLCRRDPVDPALPPLLCRQLPDWNLPCRHRPAEDEIVARERAMLLGMMVDAGLSGFLWGGGELAVLRLLVPGEAGLRLPGSFPGPMEDPDFDAARDPPPVRGVWDGAQAFWYDLTGETADAG
jgi:hypothetical protein